MFSSGQNLAQGRDYQVLHQGQHGGGVMYQGAPVGTTGVLPSDLNAAARIGPTLHSMREIQGMQDGGGRRRRRGSRRGSKRSRSSRSRRYRMRGGALTPADYSSPGGILPPAMERAALNGQHPEVRLAQDPGYLAPKP